MHEVDRPARVRYESRFDGVAADIPDVPLASPHHVKAQGPVDAAKRTLSDEKAFAPNHDESADASPNRRRSLARVFIRYDELRVSTRRQRIALRAPRCR